MTATYEQRISAHWGRSGLGQTILDTLTVAGKDLDALTIDDLAPLDQYHGGGKGATQRLARLALQEPMAGPVQPPIFPVMWARDASSNFLRSPEEMRAIIERAGFQLCLRCTFSPAFSPKAMRCLTEAAVVRARSDALSSSNGGGRMTEMSPAF